MGSSEKQSECRLTRSNLQLRTELDLLAYLDNAIDGRVVAEALDVEHQDGGQRLDEDLLLRLDGDAGPGRLRELHGLGMRDVGQRVLDSVDLVSLQRYR